MHPSLSLFSATTLQPDSRITPELHRRYYLQNPYREKPFIAAQPCHLSPDWCCTICCVARARIQLSSGTFAAFAAGSHLSHTPPSAVTPATAAARAHRTPAGCTGRVVACCLRSLLWPIASATHNPLPPFLPDRRHGPRPRLSQAHASCVHPASAVRRDRSNAPGWCAV